MQSELLPLICFHPCPYEAFLVISPMLFNTTIIIAQNDSEEKLNLML